MSRNIDLRFPAVDFVRIISVFSIFEMNDFVRSCNAAATYPKNLIFSGEYQHTLQNYVDQLDMREGNLFGPRDKASLDFWDLDDGATGTLLPTDEALAFHQINQGR